MAHPDDVLEYDKAFNKGFDEGVSVTKSEVYELLSKQREADINTCLETSNKRNAEGRVLGFNAIMDCVDAIRNSKLENEK